MTESIPRRLPRAFAAVALITIALCSGVASAGTYYRWVDGEGNTIHSDRPPPNGIDYDVINTGKGFSYTLPSGDNTAGVADGEAGAENNRNKENAEKSKKDPERCAQARGNLEALTSPRPGRIAWRTAEGESKVLNKAEVQQQIDITRGHIDLYCEPSTAADEEAPGVQ